MGEIVPFVVPDTVKCPVFEEIMTKVHHWDTTDTKSNNFDYCELYTAFQIKKNLGADAGIIPLFHDKKCYARFQR